jgi:hypothetical protein
LLVAALIGFGVLSEPAYAAPDCPGTPVKTRTLLRDQGILESVIVGAGGRLFFTNQGSLLRLDRPGAKPRVLAKVNEPGGLAFDGDGYVLVGYGNSAANGLVGDVTGPSGLLRVNPDTGAHTVYATGLSMANGLARGPDGSFYASNDFGRNIDRIRDGKTERGWAHVDSGNGLIVDSTGRYLYVAQTFRPAAIQRVDLANPDRVTPYVQADTADIAAGLDGMTRDDADRLFVTANGAGQIWRIDRTPEICVLLRGLPGFPDGPSAAATGSRQGPFPAQNLYVVTFDGNVIELFGVAHVKTSPTPPSARPRLRLRVRPDTTRVGRRTRFAFTATSAKDRHAVDGAKVSFAGKTARTDDHGHATIVQTFGRPGRRRAVATRSSFRSGSAAVRVLPRCGPSSQRRAIKAAVGPTSDTRRETS